MTNITDSKVLMELFKKDNDAYIKNISKNTNKYVAAVRKKCNTKNYLTSKEALEYGIIDKVI